MISTKLRFFREILTAQSCVSIGACRCSDWPVAQRHQHVGCLYRTRYSSFGQGSKQLDWRCVTPASYTAVLGHRLCYCRLYVSPLPNRVVDTCSLRAGNAEVYRHMGLCEAHSAAGRRHWTVRRHFACPPALKRAHTRALPRIIMPSDAHCLS